jgi:hypothetical protein
MKARVRDHLLLANAGFVDVRDARYGTRLPRARMRQRSGSFN